MRVVRCDEARARFGDRFDRLMPWLWRGDPAADAVAARWAREPSARRTFPRALSGDLDAVDEDTRALVDAAATVPLWVDWRRVDRAGPLLFRAGPPGGAVLGAASLVSGYASPAGNKPLILTGALTSEPGPRLARTGQFVQAICEPGGLRPFAPGWQITLRVRMMHALVRAQVANDARWRDDAWGHPINQHDLLATHLLFSQVWLDGVRTLGIDVDVDEGRDWLHLWRWDSTVMGVDPSLIPDEEAEARRLVTLLRLTQGPPDEDARALVAALLAGAPSDRPVVARALMHALLGRELAEGLGVAPTRWALVLQAMGRVLRPVDRAANRLSPVRKAREAFGRRMWTAANYR